MAALCMMFVARWSVGQTTPDGAAPGTIRGTVTDASGSVVVAAIVTLQPAGSTAPRTTITDQDGSFHFSAVEPGTYALTIAAGGFTDRKTDVSVVSGENPPLPPAVLQVAPADQQSGCGSFATRARRGAGARRGEAAPARPFSELLRQLPTQCRAFDGRTEISARLEDHHRSGGDPEQRDSARESSRRGTGIAEFGQGTEGYAKRFGADLRRPASAASSSAMSSRNPCFTRTPAISIKAPAASARDSSTPSRPHSFAREITATGSPTIPTSSAVWRRARSRPSTTPPAPDPDSGFFITFCLASAAGRPSHLLQEFVYRKLTTHVPKIAARSLPILRDGTPVSLISVEDLRSSTPQNAGPDRLRACQRH